MAAARVNNRTFDDFDPNVEWSRDAEADVVRISLPGFKREEIRVLVDNHNHLRTRGERLIAGTRWSRFQKDFQLPGNCNVDGIRAKFENETLAITLPKKAPSPPSGPVTPQAPTPTTLAPAASQKKPVAERRPSVPRKPAPEEEAPKSYGGGAPADTKRQPSLAAVTRLDEKEEEEERKRMEREMAGKMAEDTKAMAAEKEQEQEDESVAAEMALARQPRPISASRGLLTNIAVAVVVLLGITAYVWHTLRNATGGAGDHGHLGAGSYGDEM